MNEGDPGAAARIGDVLVSLFEQYRRSRFALQFIDPKGPSGIENMGELAGIPDLSRRPSGRFLQHASTTARKMAAKLPNGLFQSDCLELQTGLVSLLALGRVGASRADGTRDRDLVYDLAAKALYRLIARGHPEWHHVLGMETMLEALRVMGADEIEHRMLMKEMEPYDRAGPEAILPPDEELIYFIVSARLTRLRHSDERFSGESRRRLLADWMALRKRLVTHWPYDPAVRPTAATTGGGAMAASLHDTLKGQITFANGQIEDLCAKLGQPVPATQTWGAPR
ncbi:MAG: hypothetical protein HY303_12395 [Candidatus Wallbacteria bacterium]|nr:hypothetical protein [Candidatus Wallbacteria bacterium]